MKSVLVHDWLVNIGGSEKVLESISALFPSPIYTLVRGSLEGSVFENKEVVPSFIQRLPKSSQLYRYYLPFYPLAIEQFDLRDYDLVLSSSHAVAKGVLTHSQQLHICYCHTPMRYAWDLYHEYIKELKGIQKFLAKKVLHNMRNWDGLSSNRVDHFIANSHYVAARIKKIYGRDSSVIYPPVATHLFDKSSKKEDYYLTLSRMVPYKKIDLIVEAFSNTPERRLVVIGDGPEMKKVKSKAKANIEILGHQKDEVVREYLRKAKAFVFAAEEDFGITVVEAQSAGVPVIAFGKGGALETVVDEKTGLFFHEQTVYSLLQAIEQFEKKQDQFDPSLINLHAEKFSEERFKREYKDFVDQKWVEFHESHHISRR